MLLPWIEGLRDGAICLLAFLNIVLIALVIFLLWQVLRLVRLLKNQVPQVLGSVKNTATTIEGTADFLGSTVARPVISFIGLLAAARQFFAIMALGDRRRSRRE